MIRIRGRHHLAQNRANLAARETHGHPVPARVLSAKELDQRFATAMGQNAEWLRARDKELLQEHPDWADKYAAVCIGTPSKMLAVNEDRGAALETTLQSVELLAFARSEGIAPGYLVTLLLIDGPASLWDW